MIFVLQILMHRVRELMLQSFDASSFCYIVVRLYTFAKESILHM